MGLKLGTGQTAQQSQAFALLEEDPDPVPTGRLTTPWAQGLQGSSLASLGICDEGQHTELKWQQRNAQCVSGGQMYRWSRYDVILCVYMWRITLKCRLKLKYLC